MAVTINEYMLAHAVDKSASSSRDINFWLDQLFPNGRNLMWAIGPLKGRVCSISSKQWEVSPKGEFKLWFTVQTYTRKKGSIAFIDDNDYTHRRCWETNAFEETKNFKLWEPK